MNLRLLGRTIPYVLVPQMHKLALAKFQLAAFRPIVFMLWIAASATNVLSQESPSGVQVLSLKGDAIELKDEGVTDITFSSDGKRLFLVRERVRDRTDMEDKSSENQFSVTVYDVETAKADGQSFDFRVSSDAQILTKMLSSDHGQRALWAI